MIPKASGKLRSWGSRPWPTGSSRQPKAVLEPIFEADFRRARMGSARTGARRTRSPRSTTSLPAVKYHEWVLEADIEACFDNIDTRRVDGPAPARIKDKRVLALVKAFLKAGVLDDHRAIGKSTLTGTPQGGILSPLLANIALSALDDHFTQQWQTTMGNEQQRPKRRRQRPGELATHPLRRRLRRHGVRGTQHAEALRDEVAAVLAPMGLRLSPEKTRVVHIDEGFDFLGFHIRRMRKRGTQKHYVYTTPVQEGDAVDQGQGADQDVQINPAPRPGLADDQPGSGAAWLGELLPARCVQADLQRGRLPRLGADRRMDLRETRARTDSAGRTPPPVLLTRDWRFAHDGVVFTGASSVTVIRYRYRGSDIPTPWTPTPAAAPAADQRPRHVESPVR